MPRAGIFGSARVAPGGGGITGTFQQSAVIATDLSTYTFTAQPIGSASSTRRVVVAIAWRTGSGTLTPPTSVTIGGVSATLDIAPAHAGGNAVAIASAVVPSGTTADVVVVFPETTARCGIGVWTLTSGAPTGQTATASGNGTVNLTVTTTTGDVVIAVIAVNANITYTWATATERYDQAVEGTGYVHSGADAVAAGSSTSIDITASTGTSRAVAAAYA